MTEAKSYLQNILRAIVYSDHENLEQLLQQHQIELESEGIYTVYRNYLERTRKCNPARNNAFITLNFKEGTTPKNGIKLLDNILSKKWIPQGSVHYTHEQRGATPTECGKGYHIHLLITNIRKPKSQIHRELYNTVKNFVGNPQHVDVRMIPKEWVEDKIAYINGDKWDPDKQDKVYMDKLFRTKHGITQLNSAEGRNDDYNDDVRDPS